METLKMSFPQAMRHYFGPRPDVEPSAAEFLKELKALTPEDKAELRVLLGTVGYELT